MSEEEFNRIAAEEWARIPERFAVLVRNVALLVEDEPDEAARTEEHLEVNDTLLGIYRGVPNTERGAEYGIGGTLPDTITLYRLPILKEADDRADDWGADSVRRVIRETIWHEVGHYFGHDEPSIEEREIRGDNHFRE